MNTPTLEFPELDTPEVAAEVVEPAALPALATLRTQALADLTAVERGIAKLRAEHGSTDYDITSAHGYKLATARRHSVRLVRYEVPKVVKAKRDELRDIAEAVKTEGERITSLLLAIENPHDEKIKAEDDRRAEEKRKREEAEAAERAERARIEAERVAKHQAGIATIRAYLVHAQGLPSTRIALGIEALIDVQVTGFDEFEDAAVAAQRETLAAMRELHATTLAAEQEAARIEAQRLENERVAAEQRAEAERLAAERAELKRQADELAAQRKAEDERVAALAKQREADAAAESARIAAAALAEEAKNTQPVGESPAAQQEVAENLPQSQPDASQISSGDATAVRAAGDEGVAAPVDSPAPSVVPPLPDLSINDINDRLGFAVQPALLAALCIEPVKTVRRVPFYRAFQFPAICDALIAHITTAKGRV